MNPYDAYPPEHFWIRSAAIASPSEIDYDYGKKFSFNQDDIFATAGSCFAQHFAARLKAAGGKVLGSETAHPLIEPFKNHGYGIFSARYGNIYTARQLKELVDQSVGFRPLIEEYAVRGDGRIVDMLRPRAVPIGFGSLQEARADRAVHIQAVKRMLNHLNVFVFTLGLTEAWINKKRGHCYPIVPGAIAGIFEEGTHTFVNFDVPDIVADLKSVIGTLLGLNPTAKILLTVSPVSLMATAERSHVAVSTAYSKSVLRVAAQEIVRHYEQVDYFPSYEIISGPLSNGRFWADDRRDVRPEGVDTVMEIFFKSRMPFAISPSTSEGPLGGEPDSGSVSMAMARAFQAECEEVFLDSAVRERV